MSPIVVQGAALLALCIPCEIGREIAFKVAADRGATSERGLLLGIALQPLLWAGIAIWAVELVAWVLLLQRAPLSIAFPLMAVTYAGVPLCGHWLLGERLDPRQRAGCALICVGVAVVGLSGV